MSSLASASTAAVPAATGGTEPVSLAVDASPPPDWSEFAAARERFFAQLAALPRAIAPGTAAPRVNHG